MAASPSGGTSISPVNYLSSKADINSGSQRYSSLSQGYPSVRYPPAPRYDIPAPRYDIPAPRLDSTPLPNYSQLPSVGYGKGGAPTTLSTPVPLSSVVQSDRTADIASIFRTVTAPQSIRSLTESEMPRRKTGRERGTLRAGSTAAEIFVSVLKEPRAERAPMADRDTSVVHIYDVVKTDGMLAEYITQNITIIQNRNLQERDYKVLFSSLVKRLDESKNIILSIQIGETNVRKAQILKEILRDSSSLLYELAVFYYFGGSYSRTKKVRSSLITSNINSALHWSQTIEGLVNTSNPNNIAEILVVLHEVFYEGTYKSANILASIVGQVIFRIINLLGPYLTSTFPEV